MSVPYENIDNIWPMAEPHLAKAVDRNNGFSLDDVRLQLKSRSMQMWLSVTDENIIEAVGITQIHVYPQKKTGFLLFLGGKDIDHWRPFMSQLERWAVANGCTDFEFIGRQGWSKIMKDFKAVEIVYRKTLGEVNERRRRINHNPN